MENKNEKHESKWAMKTPKEKRKFVWDVALWVLGISALFIILFGRQIFGDGFTLFGDNTNGFAAIGAWFSDNTNHFIVSLCLIIGLGILSKLLQLTIRAFSFKSNKSKTIASLLASMVKWIFIIVIILCVLGVWGTDVATLLAGLGIVTLILGLGAQSFISDVIAGLNIVFVEEYKVGDIVVIDDFRGTIEDIGLTATKVKDAAGNIKTIKNSEIATVVNLSNCPSIAVCLMYVDYDEDLARVEKLLTDHASEIKAQVPGAIDTPKYVGVSALQDGYIELKIICHCHEEDRFQTERDLNRAYCMLFLNNGVDYPYNQLVIGSRALTHPQDAANPEQLQKIMAHLAGEDGEKK
jgi:small-conductance mechanosensitive channel